MTKALLAIGLFFTVVVVPPQTLHIDHEIPTFSAGATEIRRYPVVCDPSLPHPVQFRWVTAPGEVVDRVAVEERLRQTVEQVNGLFFRDSDSYAEIRLPAWKVTADCKLDIIFGEREFDGTVPPPDDDTVKLIEVSLEPGYYCGWAFVDNDDRPGAENLHNRGSLAWISRTCLSYYVVAHEFLHMIGAVQLSAPHSDGWWHGREFDVMGYPMSNLCGIHDKIDCNHDDYYSLEPKGYLADHWNSANSIFLASVRRQVTWVPIAVRHE